MLNIEIIETVTKGNTTYKLENGLDSWVVFTRELKVDEFETSMKECLSINLDSHEVYCNRTGNSTKGLIRFIKLAIRLETIFNIPSLRDLK